MFKRILLATDGSKHAKKAASAAAELAATYNARLTIVSVSSFSLTADEIERMPFARRFPKSVKDEIKNVRRAFDYDPFGGDIPYTSIPAPLTALTALANARIDEAEAIAKRNKVKKITRVALTGNAADGILEQAKASKADLVVMGTRGLTDLGGLIMGSVSHKVIHVANCACLTIK
ncbi:MAG: nucleotide-binding universal stress UspA family protein [Alphaproteobacteria bacterium]|jgi:nucleotide-binding universal stress UspA family protein